MGVVLFVNRRPLQQATQAISRGKSFQFAVIGDTEGLHSVTREIIADMSERNLAFVVHLGDVSSHADATEMEQVKKAFDALPMPTHYVPGNNDLVYDEVLEMRTPTLYTQHISDQLYSSFDYQNAHFVLLDNSYRRIGFPDEELRWLREDLRAYANDFTFLFFHRPLDVPGQQWFGDDETAASRAQNEKMTSLLSDFAITRIFNGHLHTTLQYDLDDIPVTISGGGGALPQDILGGADAAYFHYYIVTVFKNSHTPPELQLISFKK